MIPASFKPQEPPKNILSILLGATSISLVFQLLNLPLVGILLFVVSGMYHELGHTLAFWLGSVPAVPFFMIMTFSLSEYSGWFIFLPLLLVGSFFLKWGRDQEIFEILALSSLFLMGLIICSLFLTREQHDAFATAGGQLGESFVGALAMGAYGSVVFVIIFWALVMLKSSVEKETEII